MKKISIKEARRCMTPTQALALAACLLDEEAFTANNKEWQLEAKRAAVVLRSLKEQAKETELLSLQPVG